MNTYGTICGCVGLTLLALVGCGGQFNLGGPDGGAGGSMSSSMEGAGGGVTTNSTMEGAGGAGQTGGAGGAGGEADAAVDAPLPPCPCTRRPGDGTSFMCPAGSGSAVMGMVTEEGGTVELKGTLSTRGVAARIDVPQGALSAPTVITITETETPPPAGYVDGSPIYRIDPTDLAFAKPVLLTIPFNVLSGNAPPLAIYQITGDSFVKVSDSYLNAGFLQGSIKSGGSYFAGAPKTATQQHCP